MSQWPTRAAFIGVSALQGFALGATLGALCHLGNVAATSVVANDEASKRVSAELLRLGHQTSVFMAALALSVALGMGILGALSASLVGWAAPQASRWRRTAWTSVTLVAASLLLVLRAFVRQPALLEPALGGEVSVCAPLLEWTATHLSPRLIDLMAAASVMIALGLGARRRRLGARRMVMAAGALAVMAALTQAPRLLAPKAGATLLILAADSLRPDHVTPSLAPHLLDLERRGVSFEVALSPVASTTPAWVSILTGRYPSAHGIRHMFPRRELRPDWLDTLPRRLDAAGFRTSVVSDYAGDFFPTFDFGFTHQRVPPALTLGLVYQREVMMHSALALMLFNNRWGQRLFPVLRFLPTNADPEQLADQVLDELRASAGQKSAVVAFFSTTHVPFAAPWPHYRDFASPDYGGRHRYLYDIQKLGDVTGGDVALPPRDVAQVRELYDGAVVAVDAAIGRILAEIDDRTTVVLLADHGENLFEPGNTTFHGKWFRGGDEANRVPLVFAGPDLPAGLRVPEPVSLVDLMPTLLERVGLPAVGFDGVSLLGALSSGHAPPHDVFAESSIWLNGPPEPDGVRYPPLPQLLEVDARDHFQLVLKTRFEDVVVEAKQRMLRRNKMKLIYLPTATGVRWQLYDMEADPHQEHELPAPAELQHALRRSLLADHERELDAREHLVRRTED